MTKAIRQLVNGNKTTMWRSLVIILFGLITAFGGWVFNEVYGFNKNYVCKHDHERDITRIEKKIEKSTEDLKDEFRDLREFLRNQTLIEKRNYYKGGD